MTIKSLLWGATVILSTFSLQMWGQTTLATPDPEIQRQRERERAQRDAMIRDRSRQVDELTKAHSSAARPVDTEVREKINAVFRKSTKRESELIAPDKADSERFSEFLRQPKTGLIRLEVDKGCSENIDIIVAAGDCLVYTMPGAGHSYSFRIRDYRIPRLADIVYTARNSFESTGILQHGFFVNIGDVPLENVDLQTAGLRFLVDFRPEADIAKALAIEHNLATGIAAGGFLYKRELDVRDDASYILRSIAYRGRHLTSVGGIMIDEIDMDKRKDVIVAFRVVRKSDGSVTILWKELSEKDSPRSNWGDKKSVKGTGPARLTAKNN